MINVDANVKNYLINGYVIKNLFGILIITEQKNKCSSCVLYNILFSIIITINIGIATYFVYCKYMNHNKENISKYDYVCHAKNY